MIPRCRSHDASLQGQCEPTHHHRRISSSPCAVACLLHPSALPLACSVQLANTCSGAACASLSAAIFILNVRMGQDARMSAMSACLRTHYRRPRGWPRSPEHRDPHHCAHRAVPTHGGVQPGGVYYELVAAACCGAACCGAWVPRHAVARVVAAACCGAWVPQPPARRAAENTQGASPQFCMPQSTCSIALQYLCRVILPGQGKNRACIA